jgi:alkyl sulfatase BDS1-like metallo-beta-lactamase superfamily hydrolase
VVTAQIVSVFPAWFLADSIAGLSRTYRFVVGSAEHTLAIAGDKAAWTSGAAADATLTLDSGDFLLLLTGRLSSQKLINSGRAQASGDLEAAKQLSALFKAYGGR